MSRKKGKNKQNPEPSGPIPAVASYSINPPATPTNGSSCFGYWDPTQMACGQCDQSNRCRDHFVNHALFEALSAAEDTEGPSAIGELLGVSAEAVIEGTKILNGVLGQQQAPQAPPAPQYQAPQAPPAPQYQAPSAPPAPQYQAPSAPPAPQYQAPQVPPAPPAPQYQAPQAPQAPPAPQYQAPQAPPAPQAPQQQAAQAPYRARRGRKPADLITCPQCGGSGLVSLAGNNEICSICSGYGNVSAAKLGGDKSPSVAVGSQPKSGSAPMVSGTGELPVSSAASTGNGSETGVGGGDPRGEMPSLPVSIPGGNVPHPIQCGSTDSGLAPQRGRPKKEKDPGVVGGAVFSTEDIIQLIRSGRVTSLSLTFNL